MKKPKGFFTYFHLSDMIGLLSDEQAGRLYKALLRYGDLGKLPDLTDDLPLNMAFSLMKKEIDVNFERYNEICEKRREAGKKGGIKTQENRRADDAM